MSSKREKIEKANSYTTLANISERDNSIKIAKDFNQLVLLGADSDGVLEQEDDKVYSLRSGMDNIHSFSHPIIYKGNAFIDTRAFVGRDGKIRLGTDFKLLMDRAKLELLWMENSEVFTGISSILVDVFASWLSGSLSRRLDLDMDSVTTFRIVAGVYYMGLINREDDIDVDEANIRILRMIPRLLRIPAPIINLLLEQYPGMLENLYRHTTDENRSKLSELTITLDELSNKNYDISKATLYGSMLNGAFIGANSSSTAAVALELVPTLANLIYLTRAKGIQSRTEIGRVVSGIIKKHDFDNFDSFMKKVL